MRFLYIVIICIFASANVLAADLLPLDKDGFGGIKWGTEFSSADKLGMKECFDYGDRIICARENESLIEIGGVHVEVYYVFTGAYFQYVAIKFDQASQWPAITNALTKAYGKSGFDRNGFAYEKTLGAIFFSGRYLKRVKQTLQIGVKDIKGINIKEAAINRFDKMALSVFSGAERKSLEGLLGARWGMTVDQIPNKLLLVSAFSNVKIYAQIENLYFASIPVNYVEYEFCDDKLVSLSINVWTRLELLQETAYTNLLEFFRDIIELNFGKMEEMPKSEGYRLRLPPATMMHVSTSYSDDGNVNIDVYKFISY